MHHSQTAVSERFTQERRTQKPPCSTRQLLPFFAEKHRFLCFYWHFTGTRFDPFRPDFVRLASGSRLHGRGQSTESVKKSFTASIGGHARARPMFAWIAGHRQSRLPICTQHAAIRFHARLIGDARQLATAFGITFLLSDPSVVLARAR